MPILGQPATGLTHSLRVGGVEILAEAPLDVAPVHWSDGTSDAVESLTFTLEDTTATRSIPGGADVRLTVSGIAVFGGTFIRRRYVRLPGAGRLIQCTAVSYDSWLDWRIVPRWSSRRDLAGRVRRLRTDRSMVRDIISRRCPMLSAPGTTVNLTRSDMGLVRVAGVTVRQALEVIAEDAQTASSTGARRYYVDATGRVHWYLGLEGGTAPARIADGSYVRDVIGTSGLVEYWSLREEGGTLSYGSQGVADLTQVGGWTQGVTAGVINEPAYRAVTFDGSADYGTASGASLHPGDTFGLECWFKRNATGTAQTLISAGTGDYEVGFDASDKLVVIREGVGDNFVSTAAYTDTSWHHLAVRRVPGTTTVLVDGASVAGTPTARTFVAAAGAVNVGRRLSVTDRYFSGSMQHVAIYSSGPSDATALAHYRQGVSITPEDGWLDEDWVRTIHDVYVRGRVAKGSGWVRGAGSDFQRGAIQTFIQREHSNTALRRGRSGRAYLRRHKKVRSGFLRTSHAGDWRSGQTLYVTDDAYGLDGEAFEIRRVEASLGVSGLSYDIDYGARRRSLLDHLRQGERTR